MTRVLVTEEEYAPRHQLLQALAGGSGAWIRRAGHGDGGFDLCVPRDALAAQLRALLSTDT